MKNYIVSAILALPLLLVIPSVTATKYTGSKLPIGYNKILFNDSCSAYADNSVTAYMLYDSLHLNNLGLSQKAFNYAYKGYRKLLKAGALLNSNILTICDFSQSSKNKRLYLIDIENVKLLINTYVAHGKKSGAEFANSFSNKPESNQSSLGFYITKTTYSGANGFSLRLNGVEKGINDNAEKRNIVVHGAGYVGQQFLQFSRYMGRSYGCPAVPENVKEDIINTIKNGSCLFIYHPNSEYENRSMILNG